MLLNVLTDVLNVHCLEDMLDLMIDLGDEALIGVWYLLASDILCKINC